jgi:hypothetical protein
MDAKALLTWAIVYAVAFAVAIAACFYLVPRAYAQQQQCPHLSALVDELGEKYGEQVIWGGTAAQGQVRFMLFQSPEGTWTFVQVQGVQACPVAAGQSGTGPAPEQPGEAT